MAVFTKIPILNNVKIDINTGKDFNLSYENSLKNNKRIS